MTKNRDIRHELEHRILLLDGGFGTMIQQYGLDEADYRGKEFAASEKLLRGCNDLLNLTRPETIREIRRAKRALGYGILTAFAAGLVMVWLAFFHGDALSLLFAKDAAVAAASHSYLKAYAIDCMLTPFLFCFMGYYNGCEKTLFVMLQGIIGAFGVRIPIAYLVSRIPGATLFQIGLGTPASSTVQFVLCLAMFLYLERRQRREALCGAVTGP